MHNKITTEMSICQAENGFSLEELVKKLADAFENKAFADILKMNLQLTQEVLMHRIFNNSSSQQCWAVRSRVFGRFRSGGGWSSRRRERAGGPPSCRRRSN